MGMLGVLRGGGGRGLRCVGGVGNGWVFWRV